MKRTFSALSEIDETKKESEIDEKMSPRLFMEEVSVEEEEDIEEDEEDAEAGPELPFINPRAIVRSRYYAFKAAAKKFAHDHVVAALLDSNLNVSSGIIIAPPVTDQNLLNFSKAVREVLERFERTVARELKAASKCTALLDASASDPFQEEEDDSDHEGMSEEDANLDVENYFDDLLQDQDAYDEGRCLVAELDGCMQKALDETLGPCCTMLDEAVAQDAENVLRTEWRAREKAFDALLKEHSRHIEGGRILGDRMITHDRWAEGLDKTMEAKADGIGERLGAQAKAVYLDPVTTFHVKSDRYLLEICVKPPAKHPRSVSQFDFRIGNEVSNAVARFGKRMQVMSNINAAAEEAQRLKRDEAALLRSAVGEEEFKEVEVAVPPVVSAAEWFKLLLEGKWEVNRVMTVRVRGFYLSGQMQATVMGMLYAMVKSSSKLPTLDTKDFRGLISMVIPLLVEELSYEIKELAAAAGGA